MSINQQLPSCLNTESARLMAGTALQDFETAEREESSELESEEEEEREAVVIGKKRDRARVEIEYETELEPPSKLKAV